MKALIRQLVDFRPTKQAPSRIARYFFHECDRFLRYEATPKRRRLEEGGPPFVLDHSLVTRAILQGGYEWEERVLREHLEAPIVAPGTPGSALHDRRHGIHEVIAQV